MANFSELIVRRERSGSDGGQVNGCNHTAPSQVRNDSKSLENLTAERSKVWVEVVEAAVDHLEANMPEDVDLVGFDWGEEPHLYVVHAYDGEGGAIALNRLHEASRTLAAMRCIDEDFDGDLVTRSDGSLGWERHSPYCKEDAEQARKRFDRILAEWRNLEDEVHIISVAQMRSLVPAGTSLMFTWDEDTALALKLVSVGSERRLDEHVFQQVDALGRNIREPWQHGFIWDEAAEQFTLPSIESSRP